MAQAVIDLVSSSPLPEAVPPVPLREKASAHKTARPCASAESGRARRSSVDFAGLTDEFDTTGEIENTYISASRYPVIASHGGARSIPKQSTAMEGIELLSDDFNLTSDLGEPISSERRGSKRRRISRHSTADAQSPVGNHCVDIDRTDGLTVASAAHPSPNSRRPADAGRRPTVLPPSSDPFASSPPPLRETSPLLPVGESCENSNHSRASSRGDIDAARRQDPPHRDDRPESADPFASSQDSATRKPERRAPKPRAVVDIEIISSSPVARNGTKPRRQQWDPISSSAPESHTHPAQTPRRTGHAKVIDIESGSDDESGDELPDIDSLAYKPLRHRSPIRRSRSDVLPSNKRSTASSASASERNRKREQRASEMEAEKERKRQQRQAAKEARAREKERAATLAEVNKMRTDKKISTPEMIVDLPSVLGSSIKVQVETLLENLEVQCTTWESPVDKVVKWRRKVNSRFNEDAGHWEPIPRRITTESHIAVIMAADEFITLVQGDGIGSHASRVQEAFPGNQILYLLEGLGAWMRKNRNNRNRQFTSGVRSHEASAPAAGRRRNANAAEYVPEDVIEDALLELQVMHDVLIHHTAIPLETAQWLVVLTQHISTIPYKKQRELDTLGAGFCMESGQVKTGDDAGDTYVRMLQEIARVTAPIAYGVAAEFENVSALVNGLESGGPGRLEHVRKTVNREGILSDRTIGPAVSRRIHKVFTGRDESSTDV